MTAETSPAPAVSALHDVIRFAVAGDDVKIVLGGVTMLNLDTHEQRGMAVLDFYVRNELGRYPSKPNARLAPRPEVRGTKHELSSLIGDLSAAIRKHELEIRDGAVITSMGVALALIDRLHSNRVEAGA